MRASELRKKGQPDLIKLLLELRREQFSLRMQMGSGQAVKADRLRGVRRDIARVKTVMNEVTGASGRGGHA